MHLAAGNQLTMDPGFNSSANATNETDFSLPLNYIILDVTATVLYWLVVIVPSVTLYTFIIRFYFKTKSFQTPLNLIVVNYCVAALFNNISIGLFFYVFAPISIMEGSCFASWIAFGLAFVFGTLVPALITLFAVVQCHLVVFSSTCAFQFKKKFVIIILVFLWLYCCACGVVGFVIWTTKDLTALCENVGLYLDSPNTSKNFVFILVSNAFFELLPVVSLISTTAACIKFGRSTVKENTDASLTRKMLLLPFLMTFFVTIVGSAQKGFRVGFRFSTQHERGSTFNIGLELFVVVAFQIVSGPLFAALLIYLYVPLQKACKKILMCKKLARVHPDPHSKELQMV